MVAMETGEVMEKTLPVLPGMTAADVCKYSIRKGYSDQIKTLYSHVPWG